MKDSKVGQTDQMNQSFYTKQGIDYLYFARPGTAYGPQAFNQMGESTMTGFYDQNTKTIKPVELIKQRNTKNKSLLTQLWFERAEKILAQLRHLHTLFDFFDFVAMTAHRFTHEYTTTREMKGLCELYSSYQLDYDYFD